MGIYEDDLELNNVKIEIETNFILMWPCNVLTTLSIFPTMFGGRCATSASTTAIVSQCNGVQPRQAICHKLYTDKMSK